MLCRIENVSVINVFIDRQALLILDREGCHSTNLLLLSPADEIDVCLHNEK